MKGISGLIVAVGLGLVGALCNWLYLAQKSKDVEQVQFIGLAADVRAGTIFQRQHFVPVEIPAIRANKLIQYAEPYKDVNVVLNTRARRDFEAGELLLRQDLKTPPPTLPPLEDTERYMWIPVDTNSTIPQFIEPGKDDVSFVVPRGGAGPVAQQDTQIIGPFRVLSLGTRLGSADTAIDTRRATTRENIMTIKVKVIDDRLEPEAEKLYRVLRLSNYSGVGVLLHPRLEG